MYNPFIEQIFIESVSPARPELTNIEEADLENESSIQNFHENDTVQTQGRYLLFQKIHNCL